MVRDREYHQLLLEYCLGRGTNERTGSTKRVKSKPKEDADKARKKKKELARTSAKRKDELMILTTTPVLTRDQVVKERKKGGKKRRESKSQENNRAGKRHQMKDGYEKGEWTSERRATRPAECNRGLQGSREYHHTTCSEMQVRTGTATAPNGRWSWLRPGCAP